MKERPILFSAPMVRAILEGRKTQTRRVVKPQPKLVHALYADASIETELIFRRGDQRIHCPYGTCGDRLWVKENFGYHRDFDPKITQLGRGLLGYAADESGCPRSLWKKVVPSIFMPRWASRITLEIVAVRVERLQEITEEDARAEGWHPGDGQGPVEWYEDLWNSINGPGSWAANPWVWVIEFCRL